MNVKGTAVTSVPLFVKTKYPSKYAQWLEALNEESRIIIEGNILASAWYPMGDALVKPTKAICDVLFGGNDKGAWESGKFSAEQGLKGIYKMFVKLGSPGFIVGRAAGIFKGYYSPSELALVENNSNGLKLHITEYGYPLGWRNPD